MLVHKTSYLHSFQDGETLAAHNKKTKTNKVACKIRKARMQNEKFCKNNKHKFEKPDTMSGWDWPL